MPATVELDVLLVNDRAIAAAGETDAAVERIGARAGSASQVATKAFGGYEKAAAGAGAATAKTASDVGQLLVKQQQLSSESSRLTQGINLLERAMVRAPEQAAIFSQRMQELLLRKNAVTQESQKLSTQIKDTSEQMNRTGGVLGFLQGLLTTHTTQVSSAGTAWAGYDSTAQAVARSIGGISIATSLGLTIFGTLIPVIFQMISSKKELIAVESEYAALTAFSAQNGNLIVQSNTAQADSAGVLTSAIDRVIVNQKGLNAAREKGAQAEKDLAVATQESQIQVSRSLFTGSVGYQKLSETAEQVRRRVGEAAGEQQSFAKEVAEGTKVIDAYRGVTHQGTDAVLEFARQQKFSDEQLQLLKQSLDEDIRKLGEFANQAAKAATHTRSLAEATIAFNIARATASAPGFSSPQFATGADTGKFAQGIATNLQAAIEQGATFREAVLGQSGALRQLQTHLRETTLSVGGYNAAVKSLPAPLAQAFVELDKITKGMKVFSDHTKQSATETSNLQKELELAKASVSGITEGSFEERRKKEGAIYQDRIRDLKRNNQATQENLDLARQIYQTHYEKIEQDSIRAYLEIQKRLEAIQGKGLDSEFSRHEAMINKQVNDDIEAMRKAGLNKNQITAFTILFRKAREEEFNTWLIEQEDKVLRTLNDGYVRFLNERAKADQEYQKKSEASTLAWLKEHNRAVLDSIKEELKQREAVGRRIGVDYGGPHITPQQTKQVEDLVRKMNALHITFGLVDGDLARGQREAVRLSNAIRVIQALGSKGDMMAGLRASLRAVVGEIANVQTATDLMAQGLDDAFSHIADGGEAFVRSLAASLINGLSQIVASVLSQIGSMLIAKGLADIAWGIALNANPFTFGQGFALIAAGQHEVILGGALKLLGAVAGGLGSAAAGAVQGGGQQSASSAGAAGVAAGGSSSAGSPRREREPVRIPFPTSPRNSGSTINIHLDGAETRNYWGDLMERKGMVSVSSAKNRHNQPLKEALGVK